MTKPIIRIHNTATDEIIDREMNAAEFKQYEADKATQAIAEAEVQTKAQTKASILDRLGITADEAKLLIG